MIKLKDNLNSLNRSLSMMAKTLSRSELKKLMTFVAARILERVIDKTPVDTGRARMGWSKAFKTLAKSKFSFLKGEALFIMGNSKKNVYKIRDKKTGKLVTEEFNKKSGKMEPIRTGEIIMKESENGMSITIFNDVAYIAKLESGQGSKQAPFGMVSITMMEIMGTVPEGVMDLYHQLWTQYNGNIDMDMSSFRIERNDLFQAFGDLRPQAISLMQ